MWLFISVAFLIREVGGAFLEGVSEGGMGEMVNCAASVTTGWRWDILEGEKRPGNRDAGDFAWPVSEWRGSTVSSVWSKIKEIPRVGEQKKRNAKCEKVSKKLKA